MEKIENIDKNFQIPNTLELPDAVYYNVKENPWCLFGLEFDSCFRRMCKEAASQVSQGVLALHTNTSGGRLRFITDSPYIAIVAKMPGKLHVSHMPQSGISGFDLYVDKRFQGAFIPPVTMDGGFSSVCHLNEAKARNITIHFPLYNNVEELHIGLQAGASFLAAEPYAVDKKIVFYGSSITQGGCVSRPGLAYPAMVSMAVGCDFRNLGFSGSARGEEAMAAYIAKLKPDLFVMDYDHNASSVEALEKTHESFFVTFRKLCPHTPVVMLSAPNFHYRYQNWDARRRVIRSTYEHAVARGDTQVYFIDGEQLWGAEFWDSCTMDRTHPNDLGHFQMAQRIRPVIEKILRQEK